MLTAHWHSLAPTVFMPLSILSFTSLLGISSTLLIIAVIFIDGFSKPDSPGSLWSPAHTSLSPGTLGQVGIAFGLFMAGVTISCLFYVMAELNFLSVFWPRRYTLASSGHGRPVAIRSYG